MISSFTVESQNYNSYSFNDLYDFDVATIYDLFQDSKRQFWFGTDEGLVKFNGIDFTFYIDENYSKSCTNIKEDADGRIWYSNFRGQLFFIENDSIHVGVASCSNQNFVSEYFIDYPNVYYIETNGTALYKLNVFTHEKEILDTLGGGRTVCGTINNKQFLFAVLHSADVEKRRQLFEFYSLNIDTEKIILLTKQYLPQSSSKYQLLVVNDEPYFFRYEEKITEVNIVSKGKIKQQPSLNLSGLAINQFNTDGKVIYALAKRGFYEYDKFSEGNIKNIQFSSSSVSRFLIDEENNWWVATLNNGIFIIPNKELKNISLSDNRIVTTCEDREGNLYFMNDEAYFYKLSYQTNDIKLVRKFKAEYLKKIVFNPFNNCVYILGEDEVYNTQSHQFEAQSAKESVKRFKDVLFLNENDAIISTYGRVQVESVTNAGLEAKWGNRIVKGKELPFRILRRVNSTHFIRQTDSTFYVSHLDGLRHYNWGKSKLIKYRYKPFLSSALTADDDGTIWLVTEKNDLLKIKKNKVLRVYSIPTPVTKMISNGNLLFMSNKSVIYRLDKRTLKLDKFDKTDGLLSEKIVDLYVKSDTLVIIGTHHMQKISCSFKSFNSVAPIVRIETIQLFEKAIDRNNLKFNYGEDNITIEFSSSSIRSQGDYIFKYRLNEGEWSSTSNKAAFARFSKLAPGKYDFQVYAINEDGISSKVENLHFEIDAHFTQKWWFILIVIIFLVVVTYIIIQSRNLSKQRRKAVESEKQRLKKEVYKSKIAAIRSQMNPHFMFNALNTIQEFILTNQKEIASEYLADFADLMRKYLDQSMHEEILLVDELETLEIYLRLENLRFDGNLLYSIEYDSTINIFEIKIPVMLLQPFIENSIKHGLLHKEGEKKLSITFKKVSEQRIECCIEDNGIGRKASAEINKTKIANHTSFSTNAIDQKINLVNESSHKNLSIVVQDIIENDLISGTKVIIQFDI